MHTWPRRTPAAERRSRVRVSVAEAAVSRQEPDRLRKQPIIDNRRPECRETGRVAGKKTVPYRKMLSA